MNSRSPPKSSARRGKRLSIALSGTAFTLGLAAASAAIADPPASTDLPTSWAALANDAAVRPSENPKSDFSSDIEARKSYAIPALEILGFELLQNGVNRNSGNGDDYKSNLSTIRHNLHSSWVTDTDPFKTNQLGHPYQGSMYHGFARSAGLSYWESSAYTFLGSALWEIAGEKTPPSRNDQVASGVGGSFLGEVLFRLSNLVLEHDNIPPLWREVGAAVVSPSTGLNRLAFGDRFKTVFPSHDPVYYSRLQNGFSGSAQNETGTSTTKLKRNEALVDYAIDYGLPGKRGYTYTRPFDYFSFQATASSANGAENLMTRGLLVGREYESGANYRGVWGLYGSYDYIAPQTYRVSSTALSLGTTGQWWLSDSIAVQGTALTGIGYAAVGTTRSTAENDYHYGLAPQALVALRFIFGERASIDLTGREYFVSRVAAAARGGHDNITRLDASFTVRVYQRHGIALRYLFNRRDAFYPDVGDSSQTRGTIGIFYTFLGHERFGAVDWR
ncbi:MAG TPA: DUF3943 domain-containing protein [Casimicrobiaceae bacterium]|nr:DUF3943 domain-containing protein [Casimicrobiaceae bacterium]